MFSMNLGLIYWRMYFLGFFFLAPALRSYFPGKQKNHQLPQTKIFAFRHSMRTNKDVFSPSTSKIPFGWLATQLCWSESSKETSFICKTQMMSPNCHCYTYSLLWANKCYCNIYLERLYACSYRFWSTLEFS